MARQSPFPSMAVGGDDLRACEHALVDRLFSVTARLQSVLGAVAEAHGLTVQQAVTLMQLETPVPMRGVASAFQCDASNVTGLVDRLEAHDLVERRADPADRRVRLLALTEHGAEIRDSMKAALMLQDPTPGLTAAQRHKLLALLMLVDDTAPPAPLG